MEDLTKVNHEERVQARICVKNCRVQLRRLPSLEAQVSIAAYTVRRRIVNLFWQEERSGLNNFVLSLRPVQTPELFGQLFREVHAKV